ncbi:bacteriocin UviA [Clostridium tepidiprofundi DSM 19306]|uniref:Bacteriocin UviA n=1 Tax=Clostridium tepidiprofundi DSM 19306 TaxID=1121338 RepID=A0A151AS72_9CLOT|nr:sigma-70 family RNA polymerase sigma factor [Clostridium tepidiprofundi]KYH30501.1 bacteriocin UviA [Clostridium tepidiprofundi DSM 19306]
MNLYKTIENCQRGDEKSTNMLIARFSDLIDNLSRKINFQNYEDSKYYIITEFIASVKTLELSNYKNYDEKSLANCLAKILIRKQADYYKKSKKREKEYPVDSEIYSKLYSCTDDTLEHIVDKVYIRELMDDYLTENQKYILFQKYYKDKRTELIAKELGISRQAVNRSARAGIKKLRKHITEGDFNGK